MISIGRVSSQGADYYSKDNYYSLKEGQAQSLWFGKGAEALGLQGPVDPDIFEQVLQGRLPDGSQLATPHGTHDGGRDLTFSAPKSVSLLMMLGGDKRIVPELQAAVTGTLAWAEKNLLQTRVSENGQQVIVPARSMLAALFTHDVNRKQEPQVHLHAVIANVTKGPSGDWRAVSNQLLYQNQKTLRSVFNAELRTRIESLGYQTVPHTSAGHGAFEIAGVDRKMVEAFSTRSLDILATMEAQGRSSARERELVTLATRPRKAEGIDPEQRGKGWDKLAERSGLNAKGIVEQAVARLERGQSTWARAAAGIRGIGARGKAIVAAMGLSPRDGDELVPERLGRLSPKDFAAAQAVASAARELGEREAAFQRFQLIGKALDRGGPITVDNIEARIQSLEERGLLQGDGHLVTPQGAVQLEQAILSHISAGRDAVTPLLSKPEAAGEVQAAAHSLGLRRLNAGQKAAAIAILAGTNRSHIVQGGAGVGKSAALAPVSAVAQERGHAVIALAIANRTALDLGEKLGVKGMTVAAFLHRYDNVLDGTALPDQMRKARDEIAGSFIILDEASMVPNHAYEKMLRLGNMLGAERMIFAGDTRQLLAIEAGKPFSLAQEHGAPVSSITQNLRASSPLAKSLNAKLEANDIRGAFLVLKGRLIEVAGDAGPQIAADRWAALSPDERDKTILLTLSRSQRSATNAAVQRLRVDAGEIAKDGLTVTVLDRVSVTREGARQLSAYKDGYIVEFQTSLPRQGFERGDRAVVTGRKDGLVSLRMADGRLQDLNPDRLARNLKNDAVTIHQRQQITLHEGDRIRWTANDKDRGLLNNDIAQVHSLGPDRVEVLDRTGELHRLSPNDPMLEKLDLAYALTAHAAQGMTADNAILVLREQEKLLNSARSFLVAATRIRHEITIVVDNAKGIESAIARNPGDKTSALDVATGTHREGESETDFLKRKLGFEDASPDKSEAARPSPNDARIDLPERNIERSR